MIKISLTTLFCSCFNFRKNLYRSIYLHSLCLLILFFSSGGCIKHTVEVEERKTPIHYNDRFYEFSTIDFDNIWVVGFYGKIIHSKDGGKNWTIQKSGTNDPLTGVSFVNPSEGWITTLKGEILHTSDGGETWMPQASGNENALLDVEFLDEMHGWVVGSNNTALRTENGGKAWVVCNPPAEIVDDEIVGFIDTGESILNAVHFLDLKNGWVVGEYGAVFKSNDGGIIWIKKNSGISLGEYMLDVHFTGPETGWIVAIGGRILKTSDGGENWVLYPSPTSNSLYSIDSTNGQIWTAGTRGTLMTYDNKWQNYDKPLPSSSWFRSIKFINESYGWIVGGAGTVLKTTNGGKEWVAIK